MTPPRSPEPAVAPLHHSRAAPGLRYRPAFASLFLVIAFSSSLEGQSVSGRVLDASTQNGVGGADVELLDARAVRVARVSADSSGVFSIRAAQPGTYSLRVERLGYATHASDPFPLGPGEMVEIQFRLAPQGVLLDPIVVIGRRDTEPGREQFARRSELARGVFMDSASVAHRNPAIATEAVRDVPGLMLTMVAPGTMDPDDAFARWTIRSMRGYQCLVVFIDHMPGPVMVTSSPSGRLGRTGVGEPLGDNARLPRGPQYRRGALGDLNDLVDPKDIRGIEIYRTWGEVPRELREGLRGAELVQMDQAGLCGLLLVWTGVGWE
jgi:hypothetical protein